MLLRVDDVLYYRMHLAVDEWIQLDKKRRVEITISDYDVSEEMKEELKE